MPIWLRKEFKQCNSTGIEDLGQKYSPAEWDGAFVHVHGVLARKNEMISSGDHGKNCPKALGDVVNPRRWWDRGRPNHARWTGASPHVWALAHILKLVFLGHPCQ